MNGKLSRRKLAIYVADRAGSSTTLADAIRDLAAYLVESRRVRELDLVVRAIEDELASRGEVVARVLSAHRLTSELRAGITKLIGATKLHLVESVDPGLIGGLELETPGKLLDTTVKHKITRLAAAKL